MVCVSLKAIIKLRKIQSAYLRAYTELNLGGGANVAPPPGAPRGAKFEL